MGNCVKKPATNADKIESEIVNEEENDAKNETDEENVQIENNDEIKVKSINSNPKSISSAGKEVNKKLSEEDILIEAEENEAERLKNPRDKNAKTPDDYAWLDEQGIFVAKVASEKYVLYQKQGIRIWRIKALENIKTPISGRLPRDFFWDDIDHSYRLKVKGSEKDYIYDKEMKLYRRRDYVNYATSGSMQPDHFNDVYIPPKKKHGQALKWDPERNYDKPWQENMAISPDRKNLSPNDQKRASKNITSKPALAKNKAKPKPKTTTYKGAVKA